MQGDVGFVVEIGGEKATGTASKTDSWDDFKPVNLGSVTIKAPGQLPVHVRSKDPSNWRAINMRAITLVPE